VCQFFAGDSRSVGVLYRTAQNQVIAVIISRYNIRLKFSELYTYPRWPRKTAVCSMLRGISSLAGASGMLDNIFAERQRKDQAKMRAREM
jgi:hypothetical protein